MSESRFLKTVIIGLLLLNAGTLSYLFLQGRRTGTEGRDQPMHGGPGRTARFLREQLQLTDDQEAQFREMREDHHEKMGRIHRRIGESHQHLYGLLHDGYQPADSIAAIPFIDAYTNAQREVEWLRFTHFRNLRSICTPAQQQKFDRVISDALEQLP
jgi:Spy/CpxP family protein refolding chaperone